MSTRETINGVIAFLQASNNEDIALDLANAIVAMDLELERVKGIARDRLATIASLRSCQGSLDECEASLSPAGNDGLYGAYLRGELD
jgi:hypothetical protein